MANRMTWKEAKRLGIVVEPFEPPPKPRHVPRRPRGERLAPGTLIVAGRIWGRAVPWKAPSVGANGGTVPTPGYARYKEWQAIVAAEVKGHYRRDPYGWPVRLDTTFRMTRAEGRYPDTDNLRKAFADALEGVLYTNDQLVAGGMIWRVLDSPDDVTDYTVIAV